MKTKKEILKMTVYACQKHQLQARYVRYQHPKGPEIPPPPQKKKKTLLH